MGSARANEVTDLLDAWRAGVTSAPDDLAALVYAQIHAMAARRLAGAPRRPLQTTELAHEAFARLLERPLAAVDRSHFFRTAALALRQALIDAVRREHAEKRGGELVQVTLGAAGDVAIAGPETWIGIEAALQELEREDARKCRVVELSLLMGLPQSDVAGVLGISVPTVERDLRFARAWLRDRLDA